MSQLIGLGGKLRAGKDAVADYLVENKNYVKMGMSDALNEALLRLNPIIWAETDNIPLPKELAGGGAWGTKSITERRYQDIHDAIGYVEAKKIPEVRRLLQVLGTEVGREMIDQDVWVKMAEKTIRAHWAEGKNVVITAMRFPNELEMLERLGGTSVWVNRPVDPSEAVTEGIAAHASENSVSQHDFDLIIFNTGTLEELYGWTDVILQGLNTSEQEKPSQTSYDYRLGEHWVAPYDR